MYTTTKNRVRSFFALLLSVILFGSLLVKPVHILLVHHSSDQLIRTHSDQKILSHSDRHECTICEFEFCFFITQNKVNVPKPNPIFAKELAVEILSSFVDQSAHHFQLRAPPVF